MASPLTFALLILIAVLAMFMAVWQFVRTREQASDRLSEYGRSSNFVAAVEDNSRASARARKRRYGNGRSSIGANIATQLSTAGVSLTAAEYVLIIIGLGFLGLILGTVINGALVGLVVGIILAVVPVVMVRSRISKRKRALTEQLPNVLTLLVSALRAGYGLTQALEMVVDQVEAPASEEFSRVIRSVALGIPVQQALEEMTDRVQTDDIDLVVTAITVQYEMGGNLAETLENIGDTVTDRIRMKREIRSLTAQQRLTGYMLAGLPMMVFLFLFIVSPDYVSGFTTEPILMMIGIFALVMQGTGFLLIRRIVDIEV